MPPLRSLFTGLPLALLAACAKNAPEPPAEGLVRHVPALSLRAAEKLSDEARLTCANRQACPAAVGLFVRVTATGPVTCTAFLVAPDVVATNSHCLPFGWRESPELCPRTVSLLFAETGGRPAERVACASVLGASERANAFSPDLALVRLARPLPSRAPLPLSRVGVVPNRSYRAWKVNPLPGASGELVEERCVGVARTYRYPPYASGRSSIFTVGDSQSVHGNSGAPIVDDAGWAVGALQTDLSVREEPALSVWGAHLVGAATFAPLALGTSLHCLTGLTEWGFGEHCPPIEPREILKPRIGDYARRLAARREALAEEYRARLSPALRWDLRPTFEHVLEAEAGLAPACFRAPNEWLRAYLDLREPGGVAERAREIASLPTIESRILFDRYLRVSAEVRVKRTRRAALEFAPRALLRAGFGEVSLEGVSRAYSFCVR